MATVRTNLGKVSVVHKGEWSNSVTYSKLDIVNNNGNAYIAIEDVPAGTAITNTTYWNLFAEKGDTGDTGDTGPTGNGVASIVKTATEGKVDTYTITMTGGETYTFDVTNGEDAIAYKRYGVSGIGLQTTTLTRLYDAVGMVAEVGTDDGTVSVQNDFDVAEPFMHRKCVGNWTLGSDGYPKFNVQAYYGEGGYTEDGTKGDYVAVELPRCYYYLKNSTLIVSSHKYPEYKCFDIFCRGHDQSETLEKVYVPAYALAVDGNDHAVSLPGYDNEQGTYANLFTAARKYNNNDVKAFGELMPSALQFYYWAMFTVEFATQNCQEIMRGLADIRSDAQTLCKFIDSTHVLVTDWKNAQHTEITAWKDTWRKAGDYITITTKTNQHDSAEKATHRIVSVTRCDSSGNADANGQYSLLEVTDLGKNYYTYDTTGATDYHLGGRPYPTGACNSVVTPSGSPVSNSDGHHPMRYRYRENVFGNQFHTAVDLFNVKVGTGDDDYYLEWYFLPDPTDIATPSNPDATALASAPYEKLGVKTLHDNYKDGYIVSKKYDEKYPDVWIPYVTTGGSDSKYFCDYATLVLSYVVRSVRFGGSWFSGGYAGLSFAIAYNAPSTGSATFGGDLCFAQ